MGCWRPGKDQVDYYWQINFNQINRSLWRHYYQDTAILIFTVDSNDKECLSEATKEIHRLLDEPELQNAVVIVAANKQDLPGALTVDEVNELPKKTITHSQIKSQMNLPEWVFVQPTCAVTGEGLYEILDLVVQELQFRK